VFVDGRGLSAQSLSQYKAIRMAYSAPGDPSPYWKRLLQQYGVGYLIIPRVESYQGIDFANVAKLRTALLTTREWVPVYADAISLVFVLKTPEHHDLIRRHAIPPEHLRSWRTSG
jgi:hypothetical protein